MLTTRCGLGCRYCYLGDLSLGDMSERTLAKALRLLGPGEGPLRIQLSGGEPTLRPDLIRLAASLAKDLGRKTSVAVQTNGTLLDLPMAKELKSLGLEVGVSIDGPPGVNDSMRGGARELLAGLSALERAGTPFRATAVVTRASAGKLWRTALILAGFSLCRGLGLDLLVNAGRAAADPGVRPAEPEELEKAAFDLAKALAALGARRDPPLALRELEMVRRALRRGTPERFCLAPRGGALAVRPDGAVFPCGHLASPPAAQIGHLDHEGAWLSSGPSGARINPGPAMAMAMPPKGPMSLDCPACPLQGRCPGDCPSRLRLNSEARPLACSLYRGLAKGDGLA
jgi:uncharacterized protein